MDYSDAETRKLEWLMLTGMLMALLLISLTGWLITKLPFAAMAGVIVKSSKKAASASGRALLYLLFGFCFHFTGLSISMIRWLAHEFIDLLASHNIDLLNSAKLTSVLKDIEALRQDKAIMVLDLDTKAQRIEELEKQAKEMERERPVTIRRSSNPRYRQLEPLAPAPVVSTPASTRPRRRKQTKYATASTQTHTKCQYISSGTQSNDLNAMVSAADVSIQTAVVEKPVQTIRTTFTFSQITAVQEIKPVQNSLPTIQTMSATPAASVKDMVGRDELSAQAERHEKELAALRSSHASEIASIKASAVETEKSTPADRYEHNAQLASELAFAQTTIKQYEKLHVQIKLDSQAASAKYDTALAQKKALETENSNLRQDLAASRLAVQGSVNIEFAEQQVKKLQEDFTAQLAAKEDTFKRKLEAADSRAKYFEGQVSAAERKAEVAVKGNAEGYIALNEIGRVKSELAYAKAELKKAKGGKEVKGELDAVKEEVEAVKKDRDAWQRCSNENGAMLVRCNNDRLAALEEVRRLEGLLGARPKKEEAKKEVKTEEVGSRGVKRSAGEDWEEEREVKKIGAFQGSKLAGP